jgi:glycosyltransferase involved in cell wall biosynthesis
VIVLSSLDWSFLWQRHQHFATMFAAAGHKVLFVESTGKRLPRASDIARMLRRLAKRQSKESVASFRPGECGVEVVSPLTLPIPSGGFRVLNRALLLPRLAKALGKDGPERSIVWCFLPTYTSLDLIQLLDPSLVVYDCVVNFSADRAAHRSIRASERQLLEMANLVIVDSDFLYKKHSSLRKDIHRIPPGVDVELFRQADTGPVGEIRSLCYFGTVDSHLDFSLLAELARSGLQICVVGPLRVSRDLVAPFQWLPPVRLEELPALIRRFDALIIPYRVDQFTSGVMPAKFFECLATGKPVFVTPLPEFAHWPEYFYVGRTAADFCRMAGDFRQREDELVRERRLRLASENSWAARFRVIECLLHEAMQ